MNVLVDTSVWSLALRRKPGDLNSQEAGLVAELAELIREGRVRLIGVIRQETLSGIRTFSQYEQIRRKLRAFDDEPITTEDFEAAAKACNDCRTRGIVATTVDILICAVALRRKWLIFTTDPDFHRYASVVSFQIHKLRKIVN